mmetsp:Transcript_18313/g.31327  ORF Transcript_18313/g.31327 Transcript_18313/m.31327 type:complete len:120 (-) Transcript_18313:220-579(-)
MQGDLNSSEFRQNPLQHSPASLKSKSIFQHVTSSMNKKIRFQSDVNQSHSKQNTNRDTLLKPSISKRFNLDQKGQLERNLLIQIEGRTISSDTSSPQKSEQQEWNNFPLVQKYLIDRDP